MKSWPNKAFLLAGAAGLLIAIPAFSQQQEAPESILPPGFGDPEAPPVTEEPTAPTPSDPAANEQGPIAAPRVSEAPAVRQSATLDEEEEALGSLEPVRPTNYFAIPEGAARPTDLVGPLLPGNFGLPASAFGQSRGAWLATLMRSLDAPLPSRWTSILLRRALLSRLAAPAGIHPVDWVAARADLLVRMGEADAARILVQSVDQPDFTPRMIEAAADTAIATGDIGGLCPLVEAAGSSEPVWKLAEGMCAALEGEPARATALVDEARRRGNLDPVDVLLAEKVIGAGSQARRAATIDWAEVGGLTPWRLGLAGATGAEIPANLLNAASPAMQSWYARAPMVPLEHRITASWTAAALGIFSSSSLVDIHSLMLDRTDPAEAANTIGARLRIAWTDRNPADRMEALRGLWQSEAAPFEPYGRLIMTAGAASRIAPSADFADDSVNLVSSMLSAGYDRQALRWANIVDDAGDVEAWALLALGVPGDFPASGGQVESFADADDSRGKIRSQLLLAALAGLERLAPDEAAALAGDLGFDLAREDRWTRAIDAAARRREPGTVALLAAVGMQTADWGGVPPSYLFRLTRALRAVGLDYEARMIAAEAIARL